MIPHIQIRGDALDRGQMYGEQAADRIRLSIDGYAQLFGHYAGWDWPTVVAQATRFIEPIAAFDERYLDEMRGIARGAAVSFEDILAINVRTEIMFAAKARSATATLPRFGECTSFACLPAPGSDLPVLMGQNWDWALHATDTVVVVEAHQDDGPAYVTAVEAGLLAKAGFNAHGLGIATNALVSDTDRGEPGVPYHVLLRGMLDAGTASEALAVLQRGFRSSSACYVIGHRDGHGAVVEASPGDFSELRLIQPDDDGILLHGNHFERNDRESRDVGIWLMPDSPFRTQRARAILRHHPGPPTVSSLVGMLADHAGEPSAICCHPHPREHPLERSTTVYAMVTDLQRQTMSLTAGPPCSAPVTERSYADHLATS